MPEREHFDCEYHLVDERQGILKSETGVYPALLNIDIDNLAHALSEPSLKNNLSRQGAILFRALFPADTIILDGYRGLLSVARQQEKRLRFRLHISSEAPARLHKFNWELLYDEREGRCLSRWRETAFSRYASVPLPVPSTKVKNPRLLVVISAPTNWEELKLAQIDREQVKKEITAALTPLAKFMPFEILDPPATSGKIRQRILRGDIQAVHIYAHGLLVESPGTGLSNAQLVLEQEDGKGDKLSEEIFSEIFAGLDELRLATLMTCYGGVQTLDNPFGGLGPALVRQGVPSVIAMRRAVSFVAAQIFTEGFYDNLTRYGQVDVAANEARQLVFLALSGGHAQPSATVVNSEWSNSVLTMRLTDGRLWERQEQPTIRLTDSTTAVKWPSIIQAVDDRKVIPIIGPDLNRGLLLSNENVTELWATEYNYSKYNYPSNNRNDLPRVAQFVEIMEDRGYPHGRLLSLMKEDLLTQQDVKERARMRKMSLTDVIREIAPRIFDQDEDSTYRILAELPFSAYLTSNFDGYLTAALEWVRCSAKKDCVQRQRCLWRSNFDKEKDYKSYAFLKGAEDKPLVFHLYGDDTNSAALVLTEDDHLNWLRAVSKDQWRIPRVMRASLTESLLLFLGFNVRDLDFRVLFKGLLDDLNEQLLPRIAVLQIQPDEGSAYEAEAILNFLSKDCSNNLKIQLYPGSARSFLIELRNRLRRR